ncbi:MAG: extradiol ring-cleavage dioxygenase, partial [Chloroflexota bacterium]|nr:extradiol ring-cleavage dioxygenase [Chloroflexota bacterium]
MPLVFACIAPHGSIAIPEAKPQDRPTLASATTAGMLELGRRFAAAEPDVSIVLTPHNIHVEGAMAVIDAAAVSGDLAQWGSPIASRIPIDRELALSVRDAIRDAGIPVVAVSYGANDPTTAVFPMDWAVLIPAHFMGGRSTPQVPVAVVAPARDLADHVHVRA